MATTTSTDKPETVESGSPENDGVVEQGGGVKETTAPIPSEGVEENDMNGSTEDSDTKDKTQDPSEVDTRRNDGAKDATDKTQASSEEDTQNVTTGAQGATDKTQASSEGDTQNVPTGAQGAEEKTQAPKEGEAGASSERLRPEQAPVWWKTVLDTFNCCSRGTRSGLGVYDACQDAEQLQQAKKAIEEE